MSTNETFMNGNVPELQAIMSMPELPLSLHLELADPEVVHELRKHPDSASRARYATTALRIGVLAMRNAGGELDARTVKEAGDRLIGDIRELLATREGSLTNEVSTLFHKYLDPQNGSFAQAVDHLLGDNGDLARILSDHLDPDHSS